MKIDFNGRTALVTGGTRGIGKAIAESLIASGAEVYITGTGSNSDRHYLQVDFNDDTSTAAFVEKVKALPRIDICVNNAGINIVNDFCEVDLDEFMKVQRVNIISPRRLLSAVVPKMKTQHYGRIVNIASIWSVINRPGRTSYGISKNAVVGLTKSLAVELAPYNIMVNAVSPGFTLTELTLRTNTAEQLKSLEQKIPARRLAKPMEQANVVTFLCSEQNSYMTGQNIVVDGGYSNE